MRFRRLFLLFCKAANSFSPTSYSNFNTLRPETIFLTHYGAATGGLAEARRAMAAQGIRDAICCAVLISTLELQVGNPHCMGWPQSDKIKV